MHLTGSLTRVRFALGLALAVGTIGTIGIATTTGHAQSPPRAPVISTLDVAIPAAPAMVTIAGQRHLVYELHLTNFRSSDVILTSIDVLDVDRDQSIASINGERLRDRLGRPGAPPDLADRRVVAAGLRAVVYLWLPLDATVPTPARLRHRIVANLPGASARDAMAIETGAVAVRGDRLDPLDPPLRGGPWVALYDPLLIGGHRTAIYALSGRARIPARFAIDFVRLADAGGRARGDVTQIANWYGYGADVLAVADGVIVEARDDIAEASTLVTGSSPHPRVPLENVSGNFICLALKDGRFAFYEHLKHGSVRVASGDRVTRGQVIAALGNSGGSSAGPHLHFHVADARDELAAEGLPYAFSRFDVLGAYTDIAAFATDRPWNAVPQAAGGTRRDELPAPNVVVTFPH